MSAITRILNLDGIPSDAPRSSEVPYFRINPMGGWQISNGSMLFEIDDICVRLYDALERKLMEGTDNDSLKYFVPQFASIAGLNSECKLSKDLFQKILCINPTFPEINRYLYLYDCHHLISAIQGCSSEIEQIMGEFYSSLNEEDLFMQVDMDKDGIRFTRSPTTTRIFAYLSFIFIRMHSLLDYTVKLAFEAENLRKDFSKYPKLSSGSLQYGDRKRISFNNALGTLFESCQFMTSVESIRNRVIHDGLLDDMPKAYERIVNGSPVERFILFPDMPNGRFDKHINRSLFYGDEDRINLRLPYLIFEFQARQATTLGRILYEISS